VFRSGLWDQDSVVVAAICLLIPGGGEELSRLCKEPCGREGLRQTAGVPPSIRILVIDDDSELTQLVADYLEPMGFEVAMEQDGERGAERALAESWQVVILDVMMPGCDGFEVLRRIRAKSKVPVMRWIGLWGWNSVPMTMCRRRSPRGSC
jgi:CheY-like chemotaxis protein